MNEIWLDCKNYENYFKVSNTGKVFSKRTNKEIKFSIHKNGYYVFCTRLENGRKGKAICLRVHRLVAETFLPQPSKELLEDAENYFYKKVIVNHIDGNKLNNNVQNLEWSNSQKNTQHAIDMGLFSIENIAVGEKVKNSKIKDYQVPLIREYFNNNFTGEKGNKQKIYKELAELYNVSSSTIKKIILRENFKHIP